MSAMDEMALNIFKKLLPPEVINMLSADNLKKLQSSIEEQYQLKSNQLSRIEQMLEEMQAELEQIKINTNPAPSWGERIANGDGIIFDQEPLQVLIMRSENDGSNDSGGHALGNPGVDPNGGDD